MRTSGVVADSRRFGPHDHVAYCGDGPERLDALAVASFTAADPSLRLIFVADDPDPARLAAVPDVQRDLERGRVVVADNHDVYAPVAEGGADFDPRAQLDLFTGLIAEARDAGYSGIHVVAENTRMLQGDDALVDRWVAWEQVTDRWQSADPVTGLCYFDRAAVDAGRLERLAAVHPILVGTSEPRFRSWFDDDALVLSGSIDAADETALLQAVHFAASDGAIVLDLAGVRYLHHRPLLSLAKFGADLDVRLRAARPIVERQLALLGRETTRLRLI